MARTPLLRAFRSLAEEHRAAGRLGIEPAELRGLRAEALSRRDFLKRAGAAGAALTMGPAVLARRANAATAPRIAIVGAGISGLNAALTLADKGVDCTVYESSTRIGGRMHSETSGYFANGQVAEYCGELIDTGHTTIRKLARRFRLQTVDLLAAQPDGTTDTYWFFGSAYPVARADADFRPVFKILDAQVTATDYPTTWDSSTDAGRMFSAMSVYDWIESYVPGGHHSKLGALLDAAYNIEYGAETRDQAALNLMYLLGFQPTPKSFEIYGESDERFHIDGGNEQLPQAVAGALPDGTLKLGWAMQSIRTKSDGTVSMTFSTPGRPREVVADQVILALPFAVLRTLDFSGAGFDKRKRTAITQQGAGRNAKLQLQFKSRLWNARGSNGNIYTDLGTQSAWDVTRGQGGATGIVVDYSGGDVASGYTPSTPYSNAASNPQVAVYAKQCLTRLETLFPGISKEWNGKALLSTPWRDPNLNLAYSYWRVGQYTAFAGYEAVPQGAIHFAGEHTSVDFQGYMEGGAAEGARAAAEVLAAVKR
jgi:monoamine oxidase